MENKIELRFKNTISRLAGNSFGQQVYNEQVKDKVDLNSSNIIVIPRQIEDIAISFVQGFIKEILEKISKEEFSNLFIIEGNDKVVNKFNRSIFF